MDVRCEQCGTIYEFDDVRVGPTGITVKCTTCEHIFKVFGGAGAPAPAVTAPVAPALAPAAGIGTQPAPQAAAQEEEKRWLIRKPSGEIFRFRELTTLQQWIVEQKVSREDEISRTGKVWERLGAIKELGPFFLVVDKAKAAEAQAMAKTLLASEADAPKPAPAQPASAMTPYVATLPATTPVAAPGGAPVAAPAPAPAAPAAPPAPAAPMGAAARPSPNAAPTPSAVAAPGGMIASEQAHGVPSSGADPSAAVSEPYTMGAPVEDAPSPAFEANGVDVGDEADGRQAAWERRPSPRRERDDPTDVVDLDDYTPVPRGSGFVKMALVILLGTAAGFGGFAAWTQWDRIKAIFSGSSRSTEGAYYKSRTLFRLDTDSSFQQALDQLARILGSGGKELSAKEKANALATQAEIYAAWAQYLRDDAEDLAKQASALEKGARATPGAAEPEALRRQASDREQQARDKAAKALHLAQQAQRLVASLRTKRALAEASRVAKEPAEVVTGLVNDALTLGANDAELHYSYAMLAYDRGEWEIALGRLRKAIELSNQKTGRPFFRAQMRLARVYVLSGKPAEARTVLESITDRNPSHVRATMLLERLKEEATAPVVTPTDAGVASRPPDGGAGMAPDPRHVTPGEADVGEDYNALVRRAEKLAFSGNSTQALALYRRALQKEPSGVEALTGLGYAHLDLKHMGEAVAHFRRALGISPAYGEALIGMAEASQRTGNLRQALKYYRTYLQNHPSGRRAVLAQTNVKELEEKVGTPAENPTDPGTGPARVTEPPPPMEPERPPAMEPERPPTMEPERPPARVTEPPPAMEPERPPARVTEPPPAMEPERPPPMRVAEPPPASSAEGM